jgi:hypothetical protein
VDIVYLGAIALFLALLVGLVLGCARLGENA